VQPTAHWQTGYWWKAGQCQSNTAVVPQIRRRGSAWTGDCDVKVGDGSGWSGWSLVICQRDARQGIRVEGRRSHEEGFRLAQDGPGLGLMSGEHMPRESWCWWARLAH
jgi:hypothetical protein